MARMHTAEHILTAVMRQLFDSPRNLEMHLGEKKSKCDYAVSRAMSDEDAAEIERAVNSEIKKDYPLTYEVLPIDVAREDYDLWKVPPSKVPPGAEMIRIVHIGDFDATPCSGEHVERTGQVGDFRIKSYSMKDENIVRIRFSV